jgi:light-regulated signal transduction histidine kinase (bacteriophytochrome)
VGTIASVQPQRSTSEEEVFELFLDRAIHDLRASARQIGTSAEMLCDSVRTGPPEDREADREANLRRIREGVAGMTSLLMAMGSYAVTLARSNYTFRRVNLKTALASASARLRERIAAAHATVIEQDLPQVTGDADRLSEVFQHLIGNALTYRSEAAPRIEIRAAREQDAWRISVKDNGIGFEPKYCQRVFVPFFRLHGPEVPGVGLGLAVSERILNAHQGRVWIESEKGSGTTCFFTLPAGDDQTES